MPADDTGVGARATLASPAWPRRYRCDRSRDRRLQLRANGAAAGVPHRPALRSGGAGGDRCRAHGRVRAHGERRARAWRLAHAGRRPRGRGRRHRGAAGSPAGGRPARARSRQARLRREAACRRSRRRPGHARTRPQQRATDGHRFQFSRTAVVAAGQDHLGQRGARAPAPRGRDVECREPGDAPAPASWKTASSGGGGLLGNFVCHCLHYLEWFCGPIPASAGGCSRCRMASREQPCAGARLRLRRRRQSADELCVFPRAPATASSSMARTAHSFLPIPRPTISAASACGAPGAAMTSWQRWGSRTHDIHRSLPILALRPSRSWCIASSMPARAADTPSPGFAEGYRVQCLIDAARRAHASGRWIEFPPPEGSSGLSARRILVTGGSGFIGSALVKALVRRGESGARVRRQFARSLAPAARSRARVEFIEGDIRDPAAVDAAMRGIDEVHHLAFVNGTATFYSAPDLVLDVGVKGIVNVIDGCRHQGVGRLILASSSEVYQSPPHVPTDESAPLVVPDPLNPRLSYGAGKIISEMMAINYGRKHFERVLIFRPHNVYGPDMGFDHVIPQFARAAETGARARRRRRRACLSDPRQRRGDAQLLPRRRSGAGVMIMREKRRASRHLPYRHHGRGHYRRSGPPHGEHRGSRDRARALVGARGQHAAALSRYFETRRAGL